MNRSILLIGVGLLLFAFALMSFPIATTGHEQFDLEQEGGIYLIAPALAIVLIGSISDDPRRTTIGGTFGNPEADVRRPTVDPAARERRGLGYNPREPVRCRYCSSIVPSELAQCPRCARSRDCRTCHRPLGIVLDRPTCPLCARPEPLCNCPQIPVRAVGSIARSRRM
jgi:hypothetical protein